MDFIDILKKCETNVSQIARDAGVSRRSIYSLTGKSFPRKSVFDRLVNNDKYKKALSHIDYDTARKESPLGRKHK